MALLLPPYPSTQTRESQPPLQAASFYETVANALHATLTLPLAKLQLPASTNFVASYAQDAAQQKLHSLIWETELKLSPNELRIRKLALQLAENLASSTGPTAQRNGINLQVLTTLAIAFAHTHVNKIRSIVQAASRTNIQLVQDVGKELVPSFEDLLSVNQTSPSHGLYAIRKTAYSLLCFLRVSPPDLIRPFAYNKEFMLTLANMYNDGLITIATGYGGINVLRSAIAADPNVTPRVPDDWECIWVSTKVALIDAFHAILTCLLDDLASSSERQISTTERILGVVFALLELRPSTLSGQVPPTPFLNRPLLADYQQTYSLSDTFVAALRRAGERDPRLDLLESTLQALGKQPTNNQPKDPGALKLLHRSSGLPQKVHYKSTADSRGDYNGNSSKAVAVDSAKVTNPDPELDIKVTQVLDIFPSHSPSYIRLLLEWPAFSGNEEKVIEALLEDTAPSENELLSASGSAANPSTSVVPSTSEDDIARMVRERRNVFDDEIIDLSQLRMGKKSEDSQAPLGDRTSIERMKIDILRRAQEMQLEEDEEYEIQGAGSNTTVSQKGKEKATVTVENDDDELDSLGRVKVVGDGESESDKASDEEEEEEEDGKSPSPETVLELAYLRDPKLFDRDAATRRSKARAELKAQTGWGDEQIEGWKIMLERNPKKDQVLQKHEFSGNQNWLPPRDATPVPSGSNSESNRGRGHSRGGSRGRGRGGGRGGGEPRGGGPQSAAGTKGRDFKERHKASRGNHNRKKGHDRKIARAGGPPTA